MTYTPRGYAEALRKFGADIFRPVANGARAGLRRAERQAEEIFKSRGIGRSIFGAAAARAKAAGIVKKDGARGLINVQKVKVLRGTFGGGRLMGGLYAVGLAALQEEGGRIKPHKIPKAASGDRKVLPLKGRGFVTVYGRGRFVISHPGGDLPRVPAMETAVRSNAGAIAAAIDSRIQKFIRERGL